jgi:hypothetical protein
LDYGFFCFDSFSLIHLKLFETPNISIYEIITNHFDFSATQRPFLQTNIIFKVKTKKTTTEMTASVNTEVEAYNAGDAAANEKAPSTKEEKTAPESDTGTGSAGKRRNRTHSPIVKYRGVRGTVKWFSVNKGKL